MFKLSLIDIKESIEDNQSLFNIKRFKYGNFTSNDVLKTIEAKNLSIDNFENIKKNWKGNLVFETSREVKFSTITKVSEEEKYYQDRFFEKKSKILHSYPHVIIFSLNFNPFLEVDKIEHLSGFFDLYYGYSNFWLFIPNPRIKKTIIEKTVNGKEKRKTEQIMSVEEYIRYVNDTYEILNYRNSKPIFVPLSLKFGMKEIQKILNSYIKKGYFNIWIDFKGSAISFRSIGMIRHIFRIIERQNRLADILFYYTNMKREIISNVKQEKTPASDILSSILGANIVGINKEPKRFISERLFRNADLKFHKARLFDRETYYYKKLLSNELEITLDEKLKLLNDQKYNITQNTLLLHQEINKQCKELITENEIKPYIADKQMLNEYQEGELLTKIFAEKPTSLEKWF